MVAKVDVYGFDIFLFFFFFVLPLYSVIVIGLMCMGLMSEERSVIFMESLESILG